ncbi:MAG: hypothetical protein QW049_03185 [Pyrobaculum sp.]
MYISHRLEAPFSELDETTTLLIDVGVSRCPTASQCVPLRSLHRGLFQ